MNSQQHNDKQATYMMGDIPLDGRYWDCECHDTDRSWAFIHPKSVDRCETCGAKRDEQPDSRAFEVAEKNKQVEDAAVFSKFALDEEYAANFDKDWLVETPDGRVEEFDTEDDACAYQRGWRTKNGLDAMSGEMI